MHRIIFIFTIMISSYASANLSMAPVAYWNRLNVKESKVRFSSPAQYRLSSVEVSSNYNAIQTGGFAIVLDTKISPDWSVWGAFSRLQTYDSVEGFNAIISTLSFGPSYKFYQMKQVKFFALAGLSIAKVRDMQDFYISFEKPDDEGKVRSYSGRLLSNSGFFLPSYDLGLKATYSIKSNESFFLEFLYSSSLMQTTRKLSYDQISRKSDISLNQSSILIGYSYQLKALERI